MNHFSMGPIGQQRYADMLKEGLHEQEVRRLAPQKRLSLRWKQVLFITATIITLIHFWPLG